VFCNLLIEWTFSDLDSYLNVSVEIINDAINTINAGIFVSALLEETSTVFSAAESESPIDMNVFLAIQSPLFAYSVSQKENSNVITEKWFNVICADRGVMIFGANKQKALDYFKIMNQLYIFLKQLKRFMVQKYMVLIIT